jgi:hypothetical protein
MSVLTEQEQSIKDSVLAMLRGGEVEVVFTKVDGTERKMRCTLHESHLPERDPEAADKPRRIRPEGLIAVWDMEKQDWRSVNISTIISWRRL